MIFSRQGYWSGLPFPSPGDLSNPGIEPEAPWLQADSLSAELQGNSAIYLRLRPNYCGCNEDNGDLLQKAPSMYCRTQCPHPCSGPPPTHASTGDSRTLTGKSGSVSCGVTAPFSWVLVHKVLFAPPGVCFPVLCKFWQLWGEVNGDLLQEGLCHAQVCCTLSRVPAAGHCWPGPAHETLKHTSVSVSVGSLGPGLHKVRLSRLSDSGGSVAGFSRRWCHRHHLAGASPLPLDVGYLLTAAPAPNVLLGFLCPWTWGIYSRRSLQCCAFRFPQLLSYCWFSIHPHFIPHFIT